MRLSKSTNSIVLIRQTIVSINGAKSKLQQNKNDVPLGLILGLFLCLLYVNNMPQAVNCMPILFADDTWLIFSVPDLISLIKIMNKEL